MAPLSSDLANLIWILLAAALVMLMQGGFCILESGLARAKNSINVAIKNLSDFCVSAALFWICGFGLMFGVDWHGVVGLSHFGLNETENSWLLAFFLFQLVFSSTATTIVSGAVAERMRFSSYLIISAIVSGLIYPIFGHWAWGGAVGDTGSGWLKEWGFIDFAGSTVVHSVGGWVALVAAIQVGPRLGRFNSGHRKLHGSNYSMATLGTILLWFGWFGFNGGSTLAVDGSIPLILVNTNLSAVAGGLTALLLSWRIHGRPEVGEIINGVIAGLVGITASCHIMTPIAALGIGAGAAVVCLLATHLLSRCRVDDVIGAVPVHAFAGVWGTLALALFAAPEKFGNGLSRWEQLQVQGLGVAVCFAWAGGVTYLTLSCVRWFVPLRVSQESEIQGLNISEHGASMEIIDLLSDMREQSQSGKFNQQVAVEPHTEVGQIAMEYNKVLNRVVEEIETREQLLERLRVAEEKFRTIFENASEGIFRISEEGEILDANPALATMLGFASPSKLISQTTNVWKQIFYEADAAQEFLPQLQGQQTITSFNTIFNRLDGTPVEVSLNARFMQQAGQPPYLEGSVIDLSERRQSEKLRRQKEAAEAANQAKSAFLATMSHEIRTPLNGVIGMLDLIHETELDVKQNRYIGIAKSSAESLLVLINDILDFSKIEAGKLELNEAEFNLPTLVEDVADMFAPRAEQKGLELNCHVFPNVATRVAGDAERFRQILVNLVGNAIKFTETGEIRIQASVESDDGTRQMIRLEVADTGIGISPDVQSRLFKAFEQADSSTTRQFGGTGLGLAICKQLVELMNGTIGIQSEPGRGATFICQIPFVVVKGSMPRIRLDERFRDICILAVDDNSTNRTILQTQLMSWGARVDTAASGQEALKLLAQRAESDQPYDLAIIDYCMPQMNGLSLAREIQAHPLLQSLRVVMLTSSDCDLNLRQLRDIGVHACSIKPVRPSRLFDDLITTLFDEPDHSFAGNPNVTMTEFRDTAQAEFGQRILIAEDNQINQIVTQEIVEQAGFQCRIVDNGQAAVDLLKRRAFDLILMDCQMPVMDGFEATKAIRRLQDRQELDSEIPHPVPIIALTANAVKGDREGCLAAGMDDYVSKPIVPPQLVDAIKRHLRLKESSSPPNPEPLAADVGPAEDNSESLSCIDWDSVFERCGGNRALVEKISRKFQSRLNQEVAQIEQAIAQLDWEQLVQSAHALKGAAGSVSAQVVARSAGQLEAFARSREEPFLSAALKDLKQQSEQYLECLEAELQSVMA